MYKKVQQYAAGKGLTVATKDGLAYGLINGFFVVIQQDPVTLACHTVRLWVKQGNTEPVPATEDYLNQCKQKFQYLQSASYSGNKIIAEFQGLGFQWGKKYVPCLDAFLQEITTYCQTNGLLPCCESCNTEYGLNLYQIDDISHMLCSSCYANISEELHHAAAQNKRKGSGNVIGGIVGAFLGSLIGVAVWVLIYELGYISAIAGIVMIVCALKGYEMLGGSLNKTGIIISCLISLIMVIVAEQLSLSIDIYNAYKDYYEITFFDAFRSVPSFMEESEVRTAVIGDLIIGYILMAVGAWGTIRQALKNVSGVVNKQMITSVTSTDNSYEN